MTEQEAKQLMAENVIENYVVDPQSGQVQVKRTLGAVVGGAHEEWQPMTVEQARAAYNRPS